MTLPNGDQSTFSNLLSRMQHLASKTEHLEDNGTARMELLQMSRELTASLQQPDEVVSLVAFSV